MRLLPRIAAGKYLRENGIEISDNHLYNLVKTGAVGHYRAGNKILVDVENVEKYVRKQIYININEPIAERR